MSQRNYNLVSGIFFTLVCLIHLYRGITGSAMVVAGVSAPVWASWLAVLVTGFFALLAFRLLSAETRS